MTATSTRLAALTPRHSTLRWAVPLVTLEFAVILLYAARPSLTIVDPLYLLFPFVWIDLGIWAVVRTAPPPSSRRAAAGAATVGAAYFLVLSFVGGVVALGPVPEHVASGLRVTAHLPPGYAPVLHYSGGGVVVTGMLYKVVGYAALAYLVAVTVLDATRAALSGVLGLFSCVSCAWPVLGVVVSGVFGSSSAVAAVAQSEAYLLSTVVYASAVLLLAYRPTVASAVGRLWRGR